ncbi:MAG: MotA/TolQ/ExbB proton channel family protein [Bdellovibrionales bacterium]|nr:MotA/TolQ/ExbB proton channel family protein [Bdellovibrionales bacterium]
MELLIKGGPVMFVLLAVSIFGVAIILWKTVAVLKVRAQHRRFLEDPSASDCGIWRDVLDALQVKGAAPCLSLDELQVHVSRFASKKLRSLEKGLRELSMLAHMSPFLGLLGTVIGMINAFRQLEGAGMRVNPAILAGGVWEALLTTAFGISIALPLLLAFHLLDGVVDTIRDNLEGLVEVESRRVWRDRADESLSSNTHVAAVQASAAEARRYEN